MGLDMRTKKILLEETAKRYCWASKKEKTKIIDEFTATTGYNRKYAIYVLKNKAVLHTSVFNNVKKLSVKIINKPRKKRTVNFGKEISCLINRSSFEKLISHCAFQNIALLKCRFSLYLRNGGIHQTSQTDVCSLAEFIGMYEPYYGDDVRHEVIRLWEYSTWLCSKRLVVFIRDNLPIKSTLEQLSNCEKCRFPHFCNEVKKCI
ncbi:hypothetical protein HMPREF9554_02132 [Treponema phagedenis F0421]|nr:hypothetical protein HMPREF9554_02132 [Treponema phagedenis F0421]